MSIFDCAIKMEEEAREYYEKLATTVTVTELRNLFKMLAAAEEEHHSALVALKGNTELQNVRFIALDEAACVFRPLLDKRGLVAGLQDDPDAYRNVVQQEEEGVRLYEELTAKAEDVKSREVLQKITEEERKHLSIVENIYSFVESPKTYLAWGEFSNLAEY